MTDRTIVLGGSGFIGNHLIEALQTEGVPVTATYHSRPPSEAKTSETTWNQLDILDRDAVCRELKGFNRVYHLAGVGLQKADPATVKAINAHGTQHVVDACLANGVDRLMFSSTAGTRRATGIATEQDRAKPIGAYQEGKAQAEEIIDAACTAGLDSVTVHPTAVLGVGDTTFTARLLAMASQPHFFVHPPGGANFVAVDRVVDGMITAMREGTRGDHYILGGENITYREALDRIVAVIGGTAPLTSIPAPLIHAAGPLVERINRLTGRSMFPFTSEMAKLSTQQLFYSSQKAIDELGYTPGTFEAVIPDAWEWFQDNSGGH